MKSLKPSIRERKRYLLVKGENLKKEIPNAIKEFIGIFGMSKTSLNFIESGKNFSIISINREMLDSVRASFVISQENISIERVSGTLKGLRNINKKKSPKNL